MLGHFISITVAIAAPLRRGRAMFALAAPTVRRLRRAGSPDSLDGGRDALAPRLSVADGDDAGLHVRELRQRVQALRRAHVERTRHQLRAAGAGERIERAELVARNEGAGGLEIERAVAGRVAGRVDDA